MQYCKFSKVDCKNKGCDEYCILCFNADKYVPVKQKSYGIKGSKRMGNQAELINHRKLEQTLDTNANMTPNSGARQNKRR